jgi:non-homologous end joining protein Ku
MPQWIRLNRINAETDNRLKQQLVDSETGQVVEQTEIIYRYAIKVEEALLAQDVTELLQIGG